LRPPQLAISFLLQFFCLFLYDAHTFASGILLLYLSPAGDFRFRCQIGSCAQSAVITSSLYGHLQESTLLLFEKYFLVKIAVA